MAKNTYDATDQAAGMSGQSIVNSQLGSTLQKMYGGGSVQKAAPRNRMDTSKNTRAGAGPKTKGPKMGRAGY
jgi:hypothetical protein